MAHPASCFPPSCYSSPAAYSPFPPMAHLTPSLPLMALPVPHHLLPLIRLFFNILPSPSNGLSCPLASLPFLTHDTPLSSDGLSCLVAPQCTMACPALCYLSWFHLSPFCLGWSFNACPFSFQRPFDNNTPLEPLAPFVATPTAVSLSLLQDSHLLIIS